MVTVADSSSMPGAIRVRPFDTADRPFYRAIVGRLQDADATPTRDPAVMADYFRRRANGEVEDPPGTETFVAIGPDDAPLGILTLTPSTDYFTGHGRAYVEILVVSAEAEGTGAGRTLMAHAETWARSRGLTEIALDVFAGNARARAFYERLGFRPDHLRLVRALDRSP